MTGAWYFTQSGLMLRSSVVALCSANSFADLTLMLVYQQTSYITLPFRWHSRHDLLKRLETECSIYNRILKGQSLSWHLEYVLSVWPLRALNLWMGQRNESHERAGDGSKTQHHHVWGESAYWSPWERRSKTPVAFNTVVKFALDFVLVLVTAKALMGKLEFYFTYSFRFCLHMF